MEYITKKDLIDCSTPDEFCFSLCCMECKTVWKSTPIRFSRAGKKPENENRKIIYDTLYEREKNLAFQKALNQAKEIFNICPICKRLVCDHCFLKDGTDAMDPALYLTEEENAVIGEWAAESVEELLGDGPQTSMEGVNNINDALRLDFKSDRNVTVIYKGEEIGTFPWSVALGYCSIESENPSLTVMINDDGTLKVDYSDDDMLESGGM